MSASSLPAIADHSLAESDGHASYGIIGETLILVRQDGSIGLTEGSSDPQSIIDQPLC
jgi:hypothetical protein